MKEIRIIEKKDGGVEVDLAPDMFVEVVGEKPSSMDPRIKVVYGEIGQKVQPIKVIYPPSSEYTRSEIVDHAKEYIDHIPFCTTCERNKRIVLNKIMRLMEKKKAEDERKGISPTQTPGPGTDQPEHEAKPSTETTGEKSVIDEIIDNFDKRNRRQAEPPPTPVKPEPPQPQEEPKEPLEERVRKNVQNAGREFAKAIESILTMPFKIKPEKGG